MECHLPSDVMLMASMISYATASLSRCVSLLFGPGILIIQLGFVLEKLVV